MLVKKSKYDAIVAENEVLKSKLKSSEELSKERFERSLYYQKENSRTTEIVLQRNERIQSLEAEVEALKKQVNKRDSATGKFVKK